jgi:type IV pilus assembly protein PilC
MSNILQKVNNKLLVMQRLSVKQKVIFFRLLSTMVNAGIPVLRSLGILAKQEKNALLQKFYEAMIGMLRQGNSLSSSLRGYRDNFSDAECSIIESGEKTGRLNAALLQLAEQAEKVDSVTRKLK